MTTIPPVTENVPVLPEYVAPFKPVPQVTPFTYRDGITMLKKLELMQKYINRVLVPFVNTEFTELGDDFETQVNLLIDAVNAAIDEVVNSGVTVQDPVVAGIFNNPASQTRGVTDLLYGAKSVVDALNTLVTTGRLSQTNLDARYALATDLSDLDTRVTAAETAIDTINAALADQNTKNGTFEIHAPAPSGNRTTDQTVLQTLITNLTGAGIDGIIRLQAGTYKVNSLHFGRSNYLPHMIGRGNGSTIIDGDSASPVIIIEGNSGYHQHHLIADFTIQTTTNAGTCLQYFAICGARAERIQLQNAAIGLQFYNGNTGDFTEFCTFNGSIESTCARAVDYTKANGNESFNGSGLVDRTIVNQPSAATSPSIVIGAGCFVYNAPFDIHWFGRTASQAMIRSDSLRPPVIVGNIKVETFVDGCVLTAISVSGAMFLSGPIAVVGGETVKIGAATRVKSTYLHGTLFEYQQDQYRTDTTILGTGTNVIANIGNVKNAILTVTVVAPNYEINMLVFVSRSSTDPGGIANVLNVGYKFNVAGYADPTFDINNYNLRMISAVIPAGATTRVDVNPIAGGPFTG